MKPANLLFILSDEHNPRVLGAAGHPLIQTPNLDRLGLLQFADLRAVARRPGDRALCPPDPLLGQRDPL
jgi:hypothetical protein